MLGSSLYDPKPSSIFYIYTFLTGYIIKGWNHQAFYQEEGEDYLLAIVFKRKIKGLREKPLCLQTLSFSKKILGISSVESPMLDCLSTEKRVKLPRSTSSP